MDQTTMFHQQAEAADARREALTWLARRLNWERRLGQLRPHEADSPENAESKQAA